jgi:hypothetical protein
MIKTLLYGETEEKQLPDIQKGFTTVHRLIPNLELTYSSIGKIVSDLSEDDMILFLDSEICSISNNPNFIQKISEQIKSKEVTFIDFTSDKEVISFDYATPTELFKTITHQLNIPLVGFCMPARMLTKLNHLHYSPRTIFIELAVQIISQGETHSDISLDNFMISGDSTQIPEDLYKMSNLERAMTLKSLISYYNIEEIFPNKAWDTRELYSASEAYIDLASMFINLTDFDSAFQCLKLGDTFEDSPRSLAMRGIISKMKGETLAAIANLVSSLQQYEIDVQSDPEKYKVSESALQSMKNGLRALNQRDNLKALNYFAEAVLAYDKYYKEMGMDHFLS